MNIVKVLIADDEEDIREIMAKKVAKKGYDVITAQDGEDAWNKIKSESPDIILLDLGMPKMDGFTVLQNLRKNPPSDKWQPVIIVSARNELKDMQKGFELEADHYITKPCQVDDVLKAIELMRSLIPQRKTKQDLDSDAS